MPEGLGVPEGLRVPEGLGLPEEPGVSEGLGRGSWGQIRYGLLMPKLRPHSRSQPPQYVPTQPQ
ncbi:hypothetical protein C3488_03940 [Streptomyces sp. Ru72]|nr:hypothetical protein C3488_03940 [Streptomyces sp. Ru72]